MESPDPFDKSPTKRDSDESDGDTSPETPPETSSGDTKDPGETIDSSSFVTEKDPDKASTAHPSDDAAANPNESGQNNGTTIDPGATIDEPGGLDLDALGATIDSSDFLTGKNQSDVRAGSAGPPSSEAFATIPQNYRPSQQGRFVFRRPLATGGLGVVSIYFDTELNREVALKEIRDERADDNVQRENFCAEAEITGLLEHPGVVPIYGMGTSSDGRPYYAMRLISGDELREHIVAFHKDVGAGKAVFRGPRLRQLLQYIIDVCNVIHYAHSRGVLHRDLKSINVMLGRYGETLVIDWGLAEVTGENEVEHASGEESGIHETESPVSVSESLRSSQNRGGPIGTVAYAPPEQLHGRLQDVDSRSDVFSIGAMLYEVLTGNPPCIGMTIRQAIRAVESERIPNATEVNAKVPKPLAAITQRALLPDRAKRFQSAKELRNELVRWLDDEPVKTYTESPWEQTLRWARNHATLVRWATVSTLLIAVVSSAAAYSINNARKEQKIAKELATDALIKEAEAHKKEQVAREQAKEMFTIARSAADDMLSKTSERLSEIPDAKDIQQALLQAAVDSYQNMADLRPDSPELLRELVQSAISLAEVQRQLDNPDDGIGTLKQARQMIAELEGEAEDLLRAETLVLESRLHGNENIELANDAVGDALRLTEKWTPPGQNVTSKAMLRRGQALIQKGVVATDQAKASGDAVEKRKRYQVATQSLSLAATWLERLLQRDLDDGQVKERDALVELTRAYLNETYCLSEINVADPRIIDLFEKARANAKSMSATYPRDAAALKECGNVLTNYGDYLIEQKDTKGAIELYTAAIEHCSTLETKHQIIPEYKEFLLLALRGKARVDSANQVKLLEQAHEIADRLFALNSNRTRFRLAVALAYNDLGGAIRTSEPGRATQLLTDALKIASESGTDPKIAQLRTAAEPWLVEAIDATIDAQSLSVEELVAKVDGLVETTKTFESPLGAFYAAASISKKCEALQDKKAEQATVDRFLDASVERLKYAIDNEPSYKAYLADDDLKFLRENRPNLLKP